MMKTNSFRLLFAAAFIASLTFSISAQAAIPPTENLLPLDTLFLLTAPDCAALRAAMRQSPQGLLWNDPAMRPFHDKIMAKWDESFVAPLERDLGVTLADFADLPQGQFAIALTQNGSNGHDDIPPGVILLLDAKDKSGLLKTNLAALQKKWRDAGKPVRTETLRGISFSVVPLSSNDIPPSLAGIFPKRQPVSELGKETKPAPAGELVVGQFESLLIVGNSTKALEPVAAHLTGGTMPSLADSAVFAADKLSQFRDSPLYYGWFNAKTFFTMLAQIPPQQPNPEAPSPMPQMPWDKILNASGLMGLKSASFSYRESHDGAQINVFLAAPESGRGGIFKIFAADSRDANAPVFVPADAVKFWRWRVDGQKGWAALQTMLADISPAALSSLNAAIEMANASAQQKDPNFDIRKNLIGNLGDDFIGYQKPPSGTAPADLNNAPSLFLFAASNPEQAAVAVENVASLMYGQQAAPEPRDFLGKKIYTVTLPNRSAQFGGAPAPASSLYLAASGGYVAIAKDSSILENYLRSGENPAKPLRETAGLADAAQHVGGAGGGLFGYENQRDVMRTTFTALKAASSDTVGQALPMIFPKGLGDWMDFSLLPDYDKVSKYFYFSVYAGSTTADGISFKAFAPRPPQLD
jgi:hypothetical protein